MSLEIEEIEELEEIKESEESEEMEERILFCGTYDEYYFIIIDKIDNNYKINICNEYVYFIDNIYDVSREFLKYVKRIL
jgi:hypothetical protein